MSPGVIGERTALGDLELVVGVSVATGLDAQGGYLGVDRLDEAFSHRDPGT
jgi:hypothetical protein